MTDDIRPVFVSRKTAAALMEISPDTFDQWVRSGYMPPPHIDRGQIMRWHWPSLEAKHTVGPPAEEDTFRLPPGPYVRKKKRRQGQGDDPRP